MKSTSSEPEQNQLKVIFFDLHDPLDPLNWSGTLAQIIRCLGEAGVHVYTSGPHYHLLLKAINWLLHRYYRYGRKLFYHIERDHFWVRVFTVLANHRLRAYKEAQAVVTAFPAFAAYVKTGLPVFMIHDATWGQVIEEYPWFSRSHQPERIVQNGFDLERISYRRNDVYPVLTSEWAADRACRDYGVDRRRISILPLGPNLAKTPEIELVERAMKRRGTGPCQLLFVGKEWARKGGSIAVEATAALIGMGVPAVLHVVGPAEMGPGTKAAADLPPFVRSHGFLSKGDPTQAAALEKLYLESDFFLLPTQAEALGVVFAEAAAYGLPCLGTTVGGVPAVLHDGVGGALFSPTGSAEEMAAWIKRNYQDRDTYMALARSARRDFDERLSSLAYGIRLASIMRETIEAHKRKVREAAVGAGVVGATTTQQSVTH